MSFIKNKPAVIGGNNTDDMEIADVEVFDRI